MYPHESALNQLLLVLSPNDVGGRSEHSFLTIITVCIATPALSSSFLSTEELNRLTSPGMLNQIGMANEQGS
jgi:hypothetical protein